SGASPRTAARTFCDLDHVDRRKAGANSRRRAELAPCGLAKPGRAFRPVRRGWDYQSSVTTVRIIWGVRNGRISWVESLPSSALESSRSTISASAALVIALAAFGVWRGRGE